MAGPITFILRPNSEGSTVEWENSGSATHHDNVDDVVTQPTVSGTSTYNYADRNNDDDTDEYGMETIPPYIRRVDEVKVWYLGFDDNDDDLVPRMNIKLDGSWVSEQTFTMSGGSTWTWYSLTWTGNWDRGAFADFQVRLQAEASMTSGEEMQFSVVYAECSGYGVQNSAS